MRFLSVSSGIEAASVAWAPLGWKAAAFSEIAPFPSAVLAHHYPDVPNHGDMTKFEEWPNHDVDLLVGGTPCQDFSIAGLRSGLDGERGQLMLTYAAIARKYRPRWLVWENVPGVLSDDSGRGFASLLGLLSGQRIEVPPGGWKSAGIVEGYCRAYGLAWRVLDAQYIRVDGYPRAVPQRRRRVFVVGYLGDWRRAAAVLFERESLSRHTPPRRQAGQGAAPTLSARTRSGGGLGTDFDCDGGLIAFGGNNTSGPIDVATAQTAHGGTGRLDFESETFVMQAGAVRENPASGPDGMGVQTGIAYTLEARAEVQMVAHALRAEGFDASEDGTGRGTPLVPVQGVALRGRDGGATAELTGDVMTALRTGGGGGDKPHVLTPIAFNARQDPDCYAGHTGPLDTDGSTQGILSNWRVRRLTPRECERLQGFPDDYTAIIHRKKPAADGPRYKALGNSMAINVMRWIGMRIQQCEGVPDAKA